MRHPGRVFEYEKALVILVRCLKDGAKRRKVVMAVAKRAGVGAFSAGDENTFKWVNSSPCKGGTLWTLTNRACADYVMLLRNKAAARKIDAAVARILNRC